jgi:prepilin-type N-terminal cleavage/methylation domain-containing protein
MKKGFTLFEMLIYIAVLSSVILAVSSFFLWIVRSNVKAKAMREVSNNARRAMEILTLEIKEAKSVYEPTSVFSTSSGQLSLETTKYLPADELQTYIDFFRCEKRLCLKKEGQDPVALTSDNVEVNNLEFNQIATTSTAPSIRIGLTIDYKAPAEKPEYRASINTTSTVSIRSY